MRGVSSQGPSTVNFIVNARCNSRCGICFWRRGLEHPSERTGLYADHVEASAADLPLEAVRDVLARYRATIDTVAFSGIGEPTLHPDFAEMLQAAAVFPSVGLVTNGSRLHTFPQIASIPGSTTVSLDATDAELHAALRPGVPFDVVTHNIEEHCYLARRAGKGRQVGINMTVHARNVSAVYAMAQLAAQIGAHYVLFTQGMFFHVALSAAPAEEVSAADAAVLAQIEAARHAFPGVFISDQFSSLRGITATARGPQCDSPWRELDVYNDGRVHPCCHATDLELGAYTDVNLWNGSKLERLRRQLLSGCVDAQEFPSCARCPLR